MPPCGDFNWMKTVQLPPNCQYLGGDIVNSVIIENIAKYENEKRKFISLNICHNDIPKIDIIFCRDCLVHLCLTDSIAALKNFRKSQSTYLLITTFTEKTHNETDVYVGSHKRGLCGWQPINLQIAPFNLPPPILLINEGCTEDAGKYADKCMGLWKLADINI